nr:MAG TPA: hypothetical protein [Caudoviricetes sp.]
MHGSSFLPKICYLSLISAPSGAGLFFSIDFVASVKALVCPPPIW